MDLFIQVKCISGSRTRYVQRSSNLVCCRTWSSKTEFAETGCQRSATLECINKSSRTRVFRGSSNITCKFGTQLTSTWHVKSALQIWSVKFKDMFFFLLILRVWDLSDTVWRVQELLMYFAIYINDCFTSSFCFPLGHHVTHTLYFEHSME
jgi:hypothetical protein